MDTDAVPSLEIRGLIADAFNDAGHFVPQGQWQWSHRGFPCSIVRIRMTNPRRFNLNDYIPRAWQGFWHFLRFQGPARGDQSNCVH